MQKGNRRARRQATTAASGALVRGASDPSGDGADRRRRRGTRFTGFFLGITPQAQSAPETIG